MINILDGALILTSIALVVSIILQSKGAGLGGLTGSDAGGVFTARRGIEKTLFWVTIVFSVLFFVLAITLVYGPASGVVAPWYFGLGTFTGWAMGYAADVFKDHSKWYRRLRGPA